MKSFIPLARAGIASGTLAFAVAAQAQLLTFDSTGGVSFDASDAYFLGHFISTGDRATQVFAGVSQVDTFALRLISQNTNTFSGGTINASLYEWLGASATSGIPLGVMPVSIPDSTAWNTSYAGFLTFDATIDVNNSSLNPLSAYGLTYDFSTWSPGGVLVGGSSSFYPAGSAVIHYAYNPSVTSLGSPPFTSNFAFIASAATPVPEPGAAAVVFAGLFVAGAAVRRRRLRATASVA